MRLFYALIGKIFAIVCGSYYYRALPLAYRLVFFLLFIGACCEVYGYYLAVGPHEPNQWLFNIYLIIELSFMSIAASLLVHEKVLKCVFILLALTAAITWAINIHYTSISIFANLGMIAGCSALTIMYLVLLFNSSLFSSSNMVKEPIFWLCISSIIYFGCDIPYMGLLTLASKMKAFAKGLIDVNLILDMVRYPLVAISFLLLGWKRQAALKLS